MDIAKAFRTMEDPPRVYLTKVALITGMGIALALIFYLFFPGIFSDPIYAPILYALPAFLLIFALLQPLLDAERRGNAIDQQMHLFITRIGVLSVSDISRKGMFHLLSEMREYSALADEIERIYTYIDKWNLSISEACRMVARDSPSELFSDFLDRLAHAVEVGEEPNEFFQNEQRVVMDQYASTYNRTLRSVEVMKELFIALVIANIFLLIVLSMLPLLTTEVSSMGLITFALLLFVIIEALFLYLFYASIPHERVWHHTKLPTARRRFLRIVYTLAAVSAAVVGVVSILTLDLPLLYQIAVIGTPLGIAGLFIEREELLIKRRDDNFAAFIRSISASAETLSIGATHALDRIRRHNFGPLTANIDALYKRLALNIDHRRSWEYFSAETGSDLITKFSQMYNDGLRAGARLKAVGRIISRNFLKLVALRKRRYQSAHTLLGLVYGLAVALAFVLFMWLAIANYITDLFGAASVPTGVSDYYHTVALIEAAGAFDTGFLAAIIAAVIIVHAAISAIMTRVVGCGHKLGAITHFIALIWLGAVISTVMPWFIERML